MFHRNVQVKSHESTGNSGWANLVYSQICQEKNSVTVLKVHGKPCRDPK